MIENLVYSKHDITKRCGIGYFSSILARELSAPHVTNFHGFRKCNNFLLNLDILELEEDDVNHLLNFVKSSSCSKLILIMHDYRFSFHEDCLIEAADYVVNLSGDQSLENVSKNKHINLHTPSLVEEPILHASKDNSIQLTLSFGFFSPRKKSFKSYVSFYEHMLNNYPNWHHIVVMSSHTGESNDSGKVLADIIDNESLTIMDYLPNKILSELISLSDIGVCFYPSGVLSNNAAPMSFFQQGKTVVSTFGKLTPKLYKDIIIDFENLNSIDFNDMKSIKSLGENAKHVYKKNFDWVNFINKFNSIL